MGIRMPGATSGLFNPKIVEQLIDVEKIPVEKAKERKKQFTTERDEYNKLQGMIATLDSSLNKLKTHSDFYRMKVESSNPDILDGMVSGLALPGSYEFEVRGMARAEKELAYGFPDKDQTSVGFGYMLVERDDGEPLELTIEPGSTLQQVAQQINDASAGVRAMVINTKYQPDPYRLLVISEKSGAEAKITIDEDTTFLEFKEQVTGRNLDILFEDVPVMDDDNTLDDLVEGVTFYAKRAEPGTRVQMNITYDQDATMEGITSFVSSYNEIQKYIHEQFIIDPETGKAGLLAKDAALKTIQRQLQSTIGQPINTSGKYATLADVGITTDPKTGQLNLDEAKVKGALADDYEGVAKLFIRTKDTMGVADRMAGAIKSIRDPSSGALKAKLKGLDDIIRGQDDEIKRKERTMQQREEAIRRRFTALEGQMSQLKSQGDYLTQRMAAAGGQGGGGG